MGKKSEATKSRERAVTEARNMAGVTDEDESQMRATIEEILDMIETLVTAVGRAKLAGGYDYVALRDYEDRHVKERIAILRDRQNRPLSY